MKNRLFIVGASGHGKVVADIALKNGYENIAFIDDDVNRRSCLGFPVVGTCADIESLNDGQTDFVVAVGVNAERRKIAESYDVNWVALVHPSAQIGRDVQIGAGTVVMAGAAINSNAVIGKHCIINTCAVVEHDDVLEDYVHISPKAALGGAVRVGTGTHIGIGATVCNNISIDKDCVIGAGAAVVKTIGKSGVYVGVPAKLKG